MRVSDLIASRQEVFRITDDATVHDAARYLREKQLRAVGVCNSTGKLVGVLSQTDISGKVVAENKCPAWMHVTEIMSTNLVTVPPETPLDECLRLLEKHRIYHLLVVDPKAGYQGMISVQDLLRLIASDEKARADLLEAFMFPQR
jgi:CBS domain-containing protein